MRKEQEITQELGKLLDGYRKNANKMSRDALGKHNQKVRALREELVLALTEGANACPDCEEAPHGLRQPMGVYEVGCASGCRDHRAFGRTVAEAVENFNDGKFIASMPTIPAWKRYLNSL